MSGRKLFNALNFKTEYPIFSFEDSQDMAFFAAMQADFVRVPLPSGIFTD